MRPVLLPLLLVTTAASCGTEIDAEQGALEMAAALSADLLDAAEADSRVDTAATAVEVATEGASSAPPSGPPAARDALMTTLYADNDVEVGARADGVIRLVQAELGDAVEEGAVLAILDDGVEAAAVAAAEAELAYVRMGHTRAAALHEQGAMTPAELDQAVYRLRSAEASFADAQARLERTRVRAPFAGYVTRRFVRLGQSVEAGDPLFRITATHPLRALLRVPELAAGAVRRGDRVLLRTLTGQEIQARVARISPAIDPASGTVEVLVTVLDPQGSAPGTTVTARFVDR